jgi:hypothetical protein
MSRNIQAKQIDFTLEARVGLSQFQSLGGTSDDITAALTSALATASRSGGAVPLQIGSTTVPGVNTATGFNLTPVYDGKSVRITDSAGDDVYGKVSLVGSKWTMSYFSAPGGTETAFSMAAGQMLGFEVAYIFAFADFPVSGFTQTTDRRIAPDPATTGTRTMLDVLTPTATNTLPALSRSPSGGFFELRVNGVSYRATGGSPAVSYNGTAVTWNATAAGFAISTADEVSAIYSY